MSECAFVAADHADHADHAGHADHADHADHVDADQKGKRRIKLQRRRRLPRDPAVMWCVLCMRTRAPDVNWANVKRTMIARGYPKATCRFIEELGNKNMELLLNIMSYNLQQSNSLDVNDAAMERVVPMVEQMGVEARRQLVEVIQLMGVENLDNLLNTMCVNMQHGRSKALYDAVMERVFPMVDQMDRDDLQRLVEIQYIQFRPGKKDNRAIFSSASFELTIKLCKNAESADF